MDKAERMALVNTMAVQAKTDPSVMPELWKKVEGLIKVVCSRYCRSAKGDRLYDYDDLCQSAYFGLLKAIDTYDPGRGAFSTHLIFYIRNSCAKEIGRYSSKKEPLFMSSSIDAPLSADNEHDITLADTLTDPDAEGDFENVNDEVYRGQLHAALDDCMERIPADRAAILRARYYDGATFEAIASECSISGERVRQKVNLALGDMRQRENIERLLPFWQEDIIAESIKYIGIKFFKNHWYSSVEWAAERIIVGQERRLRLLDKIGAFRL